MAKKTIFQKINTALSKEQAPPRYNLNPSALANLSPEDADAKRLEAQQSIYLQNQWKKIDNELYQKATYYEPTRIASYYEFEAMEYTPEMAVAMDIFADEACTASEEGKILTIYSESKRIKEELTDLFENIIDINSNLIPWTRNVCKYGENFIYNKVIPGKGIVGVTQLPNIEITRSEPGFSKVMSLDDFQKTKNVKFYWKNKDIEFSSFEVSHFRLLGDDRRLPYGTSMLEKARSIWKKLILAEDAMLVYRLCLHPETRIKTPNGYKYIKDINSGDKVISYTKNGLLIENEVINQVNNGNKKIVRVRSKHNEILCTETHPILIKDGNILKYVDAKDLQIKKHQLINTKHHYEIITKKIDRLFDSDNLITLPDYVTPNFGRLLGFLLANGSISQHSIKYTEGINENQNNYYFELLSKFYKYPARCIDNEIGSVSVNNTTFSTILRNLGFIGKAKTKRIPTWVYNQSDEFKKEFVIGFSNADGCERFTKKGTWFSTIEISNKELIEDLKEIWSSLGYNSGHISHRINPSHIIVNNRIIKSTESWILTISDIITPEFENVISVTNIGFSDVYDISVKETPHNFIANNIPVHNTRAPERRVYKVFVGNMDDKDIDSYVDKIANNFKRVNMVNSETGSQDTRYNALPVWKKTPIPLMDGRTITIEELAKEYNDGKENWVYSIQDDTHNIVPGKVVWCGKNYTANKLIKIWLDDNTWMLMAPEHPMVLRDGTYKRADNLKSGDSLMPFYTKTIDLSDYKGYEMIYNPSTCKYELKDTILSKEVLIEEKCIKTEDEFVGIINHKVAYIEEISDCEEDVYCMTVVGNNNEDDRHNFAMKSFNLDGSISASGCISRNSVDQDLFIPTRDPSLPSPIETLPGAQNLDQIEDIAYIQRKLLTALRVPKAFMGFEESIGEGKNLALMDIRFARAVHRVQKAMIQELNKMAIIHLYAKGFEEDLDNFTLSLSNPSTQADMLKIQNWKEKVLLYRDVVSDAGNGFGSMSMTKAKKDILGMSDDEIRLDVQQQAVEKAGGEELKMLGETIKQTGVFRDLYKIYKINPENMDINNNASGEEEPSSGGGGGGGSIGGDVGQDFTTPLENQTGGEQPNDIFGSEQPASGSGNEGENGATEEQQPEENLSEGKIYKFGFKNKGIVESINKSIGEIDDILKE